MAYFNFLLTMRYIYNNIGGKNHRIKTIYQRYILKDIWVYFVVDQRFLALMPNPLDWQCASPQSGKAPL
jgi:hypothetical protein